MPKKNPTPAKNPTLIETGGNADLDFGKQTAITVRRCLIIDVCRVIEAV